MLGYTFGAPKGGKKRSKNIPLGPKAGCTHVVFKRAKKGGKILPKSQWTEVMRCPTKKLSASAKRRYAREKEAREICRVGGKGPRAHLFTKCPRQKR
jgi:hypothetical protein